MVASLYHRGSICIGQNLNSTVFQWKCNIEIILYFAMGQYLLLLLRLRTRTLKDQKWGRVLCPINLKTVKTDQFRFKVKEFNCDFKLRDFSHLINYNPL